MISKQINLTANENRQDELLELLKMMTIESRQEKGCLKYDLFQDKQNSNNFTLIESWETNESLNDHKQTEHFKLFVEKAPTLIAEKIIYGSN